jgi:hypothetical protein
MRRLFSPAFALLIVLAIGGLMLLFGHPIHADPMNAAAAPAVLIGLMSNPRRLIRCTPWENVLANGMATINFFKGAISGYTLHRLILELGGTALTKAMITGLRLMANDTPILDDSGARINGRMLYRGIFDEATHLSIDFDELRSKTIQGQSVGAIDTTFGLKTFNGEMDIAGATLPTLQAFWEVSDPQVKPEQSQSRGLIAQVLKTSQGFAAADQYPINVVGGQPKPGAIIKRVHIFHTGHILGLLVKKNGVEVHNTIPTGAAATTVNQFMQKERLRVPQANVYTYDPILDGNQSEALTTGDATSMEFYVKTDAADNVVTVSELLVPLGWTGSGAVKA